MTQPDAWRMIRRCAAAADIAEAIGCHTLPRDRHHGVPREWWRTRH
jgi:hypothetical protein